MTHTPYCILLITNVFNADERNADVFIRWLRYRLSQPMRTLTTCSAGVCIADVAYNAVEPLHNGSQLACMASVRFGGT